MPIIQGIKSLAFGKATKGLKAAGTKAAAVVKQAPVFNTESSKLNGYKAVLAKIDPSKTKIKKVDYGYDDKATLKIFYDKNGNEIMRVTEQKITDKILGGLIKNTRVHKTVEFTGTNGKKTILNDFDGDGNVDDMTYLKKGSGSQDKVYKSTKDNGKFDKVI